MTYNEWKDELKSNLLSVPETERRRVLDYYAEAYADRREAGFSEREIIDDFGAPYDAAQRILYDNRADYDTIDSRPYSARNYERERIKEEKERERQRRREERNERNDRESARFDGSDNKSVGGDNYYSGDNGYAGNNYANNGNAGNNGYTYSQYGPAPSPQPPKRENYTWVFILLCIIFAIPLCGVLIGLVSVTVGFTIAPFMLIISGVITSGAGVGVLVTGHLAEGIATLGGGFIVFGLGLILLPIFTTVIKFLWKLLKNFLNWIKSFFDGRRSVL